MLPWSGMGLTGNWGLTVRKALGYSLSLRAEFNHACTKGFAWQMFGGYREMSGTVNPFQSAGQKPSNYPKLLYHNEHGSIRLGV